MFSYIHINQPVCMEAGPHFKDSLYKYTYFYLNDKAVMRPSYLSNLNHYTGKSASGADFTNNFHLKFKFERNFIK